MITEVRTVLAVMELGSRRLERAMVQGSGRRDLDSKSLVAPRVTGGNRYSNVPGASKELIVGQVCSRGKSPSGNFS